MTRLFVNGLAASAGGGLTYLRNFLPALARRSGVQAVVAVQPDLQRELQSRPGIRFVGMEVAGSVAGRFWREQRQLPALIRDSGSNVLLSTGNFALRRSPVPQILLSRNSLYTSKDFARDVRARRDYRLWLDTRVKGFFARRSMNWADCVVAPSEAFAADLREWSGAQVSAVHHGFDRELFCSDSRPLPGPLQARLAPRAGELRLLFVSHYNYYRNFETLLRAVPMLKARLPGMAVRLFLTCRLESGENPGSYSPGAAGRLLRDLGIDADVVQLGSVPYTQLHHVYSACSIYVTPAYTESFAHPLVEAMAMGRPVIASDLPVHREICGSAALYFPRFSPEALADEVARVAGDPGTRSELVAEGQRRFRDFSWESHVDQLLQLAAGLVTRRSQRAA